MVQCEYDNCTMLTVLSVDGTLVLSIAITLTECELCLGGDHYPLVLSSTAEDMSQVSD